MSTYTEYLAQLFSLANSETKTKIVETIWEQLGAAPCKYPEEQAAIIDGFIAEVQHEKNAPRRSLRKLREKPRNESANQGKHYSLTAFQIFCLSCLSCSFYALLCRLSDLL